MPEKIGAGFAAEDARGPRATRFIDTLTDPLALAILSVVLLLVYHAPLQTTYYFGDEVVFLFSDLPWSDLFESFFWQGLSVGRPFSFILFGLFGKLASTGPAGLQLLRLLQYLVSLGVAMLVYALLRKRRVIPFWSLLLVLAIWSQPALQVYHAYAMLTPYLMGVAAALAAFYFSFWKQAHSRGLAAIQFIAVVMSLLVAWLFFPASPFAALGLVSFYGLSEQAQKAAADQRRLLTFLAATLAAAVIFIAGYYALLDWTGIAQYPLTERAFSLLGTGGNESLVSLLNPLRYLGPFEWWNYALDLPMLRRRVYLAAIAVSAVLFCVTVCAAYFLEQRKAAARYVRGKYLLALAALALTFLPLAADNFSLRQHVYIAVSPAIVLIFFSSLAVLWRELSSTVSLPAWLPPLAAILLVAVLLLGGERGISQGMVAPSARFLSFVESQINAQDDVPYERIVVVTAAELCPSEPCHGLFGRRMSIGAYQSEFWQTFYTGILRAKGKRSDVPVVYRWELTPEVDDGRSLIIDTRILQRMLLK